MHDAYYEKSLYPMTLGIDGTAYAVETPTIVFTNKFRIFVVLLLINEYPGIITYHLTIL